MKDIEEKRMGILIVALVLVLSIGYAIFTTTLNINGTTSIDASTWDVHFENIQVKAGSVESPLPVISDQTKVTFTPQLQIPGDVYEFTVDVVNRGTIDAKIEDINKSVLSAEQTKYFQYSVSYKDNTNIQKGDKLLNGQKKTIKVKVYYKKDITVRDLPTTGTSINSTFSVEYIQK